MSKTVVILGAGLAGLPLAHHILKNKADKYDLKVVLVSPSDEFYWNLASVRAAVPGQYGDDKIFFSIPQSFSGYGKEKFEFVLGKAQTWDPAQNSVIIATNDGATRAVDYHTIFVTTGTTPKDQMPWKTLGSRAETHAALDKLREDVEKATSIVVGGAGATGVEFAGELAYEYARTGKKTVTLISAESLPMGPEIMDSTRLQAQKELEALKVEVITGAKVTSVKSDESALQILELTKSDGTTKTVKADLFVPTWGFTFNSDFAPADLRNSNGRLKVNSQLQAPGHGNVFILGDVADLQVPTAAPLDAQVRHIVKGLDLYFAGGSLPEYKPSTMTMIGLSVGRDRATGQMGCLKPFSILIWWAKGRYLGTDYASDYAAGKRLVTGGW